MGGNLYEDKCPPFFYQFGCMSGSSSSTAVVVAHQQVDLVTSESEYDEGFITGDELLPGLQT